LLHIVTGMAAGYRRGLGHQELGAVMASMGGAEEATVLGDGRRMPALHAAMINGATARALNLDDHFDEAIVHPSAATIGAALAAGERKGKLSGSDLIAAVAIGNEITCRLAAAVATASSGSRQGNGWFQAMAFGLYGATAAASRLTGLDRTGIRDA